MSKPLTNNKLEKMLMQAVFDSVVSCPYCDYRPLEADYDNCPECKEFNPLPI